MSAELESLFKRMIRDLRPLFKEAGFRSVGQNFFLDSPQNWGIVNFQKSRWSGPAEKTFYVNVAATAKRLLAFHGARTDKAPPYFCCEWCVRAEQLGPNPLVKHWTIVDEASAKLITQYLRQLFEGFVIPTLLKMRSESYLLEILSTRTDYRGLKAASIFHAAHGRQEELRQAVQLLIDQFGNGVVVEGVKSHLDELRSHYPHLMKSIE